MTRAISSFADEPGEQHGLTGRHRNRALHPALRNGGRQRTGSRDVADLLLDVEHNIAVGVDAGNDAQNNASVAIIDRADHLVGRIEHGGRAGGDRDLVADLQRRDLIVEHNNGGIGQYLHIGGVTQRVEDDARLGGGPDQKIEAGEGARQHRAACAVNDRTSVRLEPDIRALQEELDTVIEGVVERDLGDGSLDGDLQLRAVQLAQRSLDDPVAFLIGIDQQRVVDGVGCDPHSRQQRDGHRATAARASG